MLPGMTATAPIRLPMGPPLAAGHLLGWLAARAVTGIDAVDGRTYRRTACLDGAGGLLEVEVADEHLQLRIHGLPEETAIARVRALVAADVDHAPARAALASDALLRPTLTRSAGLRVIGTIDGYELACRAVLGQQVSVAGARTTTARLVAALGTPLPRRARIDASWRTFPRPETLAASPLDGLGLTGTRRRTLRALAAAVRDGLRLDRGADIESTTAALLDLPGIGPWTAGYIAMRALGDPDAFPAGDLGLLRGSRHLGGPGDARDLAVCSERWRPYRAYAAECLWSVA